MASTGPYERRQELKEKFKQLNITLNLEFPERLSRYNLIKAFIGGAKLGVGTLNSTIQNQRSLVGEELQPLQGERGGRITYKRVAREVNRKSLGWSAVPLQGHFVNQATYTSQ